MEEAVDIEILEVRGRYLVAHLPWCDGTHFLLLIGRGWTWAAVGLVMEGPLATGIEDFGTSMQSTAPNAEPSCLIQGEYHVIPALFHGTLSSKNVLET